MAVSSRPAFVDSHVHLTATGLALVGLDLRAGDVVASTCCGSSPTTHATHPTGPIWAHGWDESDWPQRRPPTTAELDAAVGDRPAYLSRVDVHSAVASTALRRAGARADRGRRATPVSCR